MSEIVIIGGGLTGLAAGVASGGLVLEARDVIGGLAATTRSEGYTSGYSGHWLFGDNRPVEYFMGGMVGYGMADRAATVRVNNEYIPAPIQSHIDMLPNSPRIYAELASRPQVVAGNMAQRLRSDFGDTLFSMFFLPFNRKYTCDLMWGVEPVGGKNPVAPLELLLRGGTLPVYNQKFRYASGGIGQLANAMSRDCAIRLNSQVILVDCKNRRVVTKDGGVFRYDVLISTIPLNNLLFIAGRRSPGLRNDMPYLKAVCVNIGCKDVGFDGQWCYFPGDEPFYRLGNYTAIDPDLAPPKRHLIYADVNLMPHASVDWVEDAVVDWLTKTRLVSGIDFIDTRVIDVAYTYTATGKSVIIRDAIEDLARDDILSIGSFGRWKFAGMMADIGDGLLTGTIARMIA